jgi:hypothetical protein
LKPHYTSGSFFRTFREELSAQYVCIANGRSFAGAINIISLYESDDISEKE